MDEITNSPGLYHIAVAERIFMDLDQEKLLLCEEVNENWKTILKNPWFWYKKCRQNSTLSVYQSEWENFIPVMESADLSDHLIPILKNIHSKSVSEDLFLARGSVNHFILLAASKGDAEFVQVLAHLSDSPNAPGHNGNTPIYQATLNEHTEVVRILASLTDNPNAACHKGRTPIYLATRYGQTEIVKILAPLTNNLNAAGPGGNIIQVAAIHGYAEIVEILVPLYDNPVSYTHLTLPTILLV